MQSYNNFYPLDRKPGPSAITFEGLLQTSNAGSASRSAPRVSQLYRNGLLKPGFDGHRAKLGTPIISMLDDKLIFE